MKLSVFVLKVATSGPHLNLFMNVMQDPGPDLPYGIVPEARAQMVNFFCLYLDLVGRCYENSQSFRGSGAA